MMALAVCAFLLSACGWHLAGTRPLPAPLDSVYIDVVAPYRVSEPPLETALRTRIIRRGGVVQSNTSLARCILRLRDLEERREVLSIGPDGKALEYLLTTHVTYDLFTGKELLVSPDRLSVSRDFSFNAQEVLAKEVEESRLREFIQDEMAEIILLRLEAQLTSASPPVGGPANSPDATPP